MEHRGRTIAISILLAAGLLVPLWIWMRPSPQRVPARSFVPAQTPTRGQSSVAVDRSLLPVMELQAGTFSDHYPEARVSLTPEHSGRTLLRLIDRVAGGAIVDGALTREEDSVITSMSRPVKREPIAKNALILIVNRSNPVSALSMESLRRIFSGVLTDWSVLGGNPGSIVACVDGSDFRSQALLASALFGRNVRLKASAATNHDALITRVANDGQAAAVVSMTVYAQALKTPDGARIKAVPLSKTPGGIPVQATPSTVYSGEYPLVTVVYYLYDPFDPTATGFGAWLSKDGQKFFERGDMAPYNQMVRTIILK